MVLSKLLLRPSTLAHAHRRLHAPASLAARMSTSRLTCAPRTSSSPQDGPAVRKLSTSHRPGSSGSTYKLRPSLLLLAGATLSALTASAIQLDSPVESDEGGQEVIGTLSSVRFLSLLRSYLVYTVCSSPTFVDAAPALLEWAQSTPGVWWAAEKVIRSTFFAQFVGGDTMTDCVPLLFSLSSDGLGALLGFSVEASISAHPSQPAPASPPLGSPSSSADSLPPSLPRFSHLHEAFIAELVHSVRVAAEFERLHLQSQLSRKEDSATTTPPRTGSTSIAIKLTGLLKDPSLLERASAAIVSPETFSDPSSYLCPCPPDALAVEQASKAQVQDTHLGLPGKRLGEQDRKALLELWMALREVAKAAREEGGVSLVIDAEHSWYQPAIDAFYEALAAEFNRLSPPPSLWSRLKGITAGVVASGRREDQARITVRQPLIYNTFQAYLKRTPHHLSASLTRASKGNYSLGVKLVRGAYIDLERKTARASGHGSPCWDSKEDTDECYERCAKMLVEQVATDLSTNGPNRPAHLGVIFATHNPVSAFRAIQHMVKVGLASETATAMIVTETAAEDDMEDHPPYYLRLTPGVRGRITFGQLLGMADHLTRSLCLVFDPRSGGNEDGVGPHMVFKYVPYGPLKEVLPYLVRRALENRDFLGGGGKGAAAVRVEKERERLAMEMRRRVGWAS